jgi:hypothetical protein
MAGPRDGDGDGRIHDGTEHETNVPGAHEIAASQPQTHAVPAAAPMPQPEPVDLRDMADPTATRKAI